MKAASTCGVPQVRVPLLDANLGGVGSSASLIAIATSLGRAWRGSRRSRQICSPAPQNNSVWKPSDPRSSPSAMNQGKLKRSLCESFHRSFNRTCKTLPKVRANVVVPSPRLPQFRGGFGHPDDGQLHGFSNRSDLTSSHGMTLPAQNVSLSWMIENQQGRRK